MYTDRDKLLSLIEQAERLMQETKDPEWKEELQRSIEVFKRMIGLDNPAS